MTKSQSPDALEVTTSRLSSYSADLILDELVDCTTRWNIGDCAMSEVAVATAIMERLAALGIARKAHRPGCEIWPEHRLCKCPWSYAQ